jgi:hypothetical protein
MEFINNGFNEDAGTNEHHEINGKVEHKLDLRLSFIVSNLAYSCSSDDCLDNDSFLLESFVISCVLGTGGKPGSIPT